MIKDIYSNSQHIQIHYGTQCHINSGSNSGSLRFNTTSQSLEANDGCNWYPLGRTLNVSISSDLDRIINWARIKIDEEERIQRKAALFPTIQDALNELDQAKEKLLVLDKLCDEKDLDLGQIAV